MNKFSLTHGARGRLARLLGPVLCVGAVRAWGGAEARVANAQELPFRQRIEVFRGEEGGPIAFAIELEQSFLAEEFERSNDLRIEPLDERVYLTYPKQTRFDNKHAAFYGRLRGEGTARVRVWYETVHENLDGSKKVSVSHGDLEIEIPPKPAGRAEVFLEWARRQNEHFRALLDYYPDDSFLQYVLRQAGSRYGVASPALPRSAAAGAAEAADGLMDAIGGALPMHEQLQRRLFEGARYDPTPVGHVSELIAPRLTKLDFPRLLRERGERGVSSPAPAAMARWIPADQYFLHTTSLAEILDNLETIREWSGGLRRLTTIRARDDHYPQRVERQLILPRAALAELSRSGAIAEAGFTGCDLALADGTDLTLVLRLARPDEYRRAARGWIEACRASESGLEEREFNYRGKKVQARFTADRRISSFTIEHDDFVIVSNSHAAIRRLIHVLNGSDPSLFDAPDYQYLTALSWAHDAARGGRLTVTQAYLQRLFGPELRISERRRRICFNNLVMINHASLLFRMENTRSPASYNELLGGRYVDGEKLVCPHGGAYSYDSGDDVATCTLHNRVGRLTPNCELEVLRVSAQEKAEYKAYAEALDMRWRGRTAPLCMQVSAADSLRFDVWLLSAGPESWCEMLRAAIEPSAAPVGALPGVKSSWLSVQATPGQRRIDERLRGLPGIARTLDADPTLTDLKWLGDRVSIHLCDGGSLLEIDPLVLRPFSLFRPISTTDQMVVGAALMGLSLPAYATIEIKDAEKAQRFLDLLASGVSLEAKPLFQFETRLDAYRLPDYEGAARYVLSYQLYALKVRLYVSMAGDRLIAATTEETLRFAIDALRSRPHLAAAPMVAVQPDSHLCAELLLANMDRFRDPLGLFVAERARFACHGNIMSLQMLAGSHGVEPAEVNSLALRKYGFSMFCPDGGAYRYDPMRDRVSCTIHGDRMASRQPSGTEESSSFRRLMDEIGGVRSSIRFEPHCAVATVEVDRRARAPGGAR